MRVAQAIIFVVMLTAANSHRLMKLQDNVDDCYAAAQTLKAAIPEIMDAVNKQDWTTLMSIVVTKVVPEVQPLSAGGLQCQERVAGDFVGEKCVGDVVKFVQDVKKFYDSKNPMDMITAITDFTTGMNDCQGAPVRLTLTDNVDDCYTAAQTLKAAIPEIQDAVNKQDWTTLMSVVMTKVVPAFQPLEAGGLQCYERVAADYVGQQCVGDVVKFAQDVLKFTQSKNAMDMMAAIADFTTSMKDCQVKPVALTLAAVDCDAEIQAIIAAVPTITAHLSQQNFLALIGDLTSVKPHIDNITASCVKKSDACTTIQNNVMTNLNNILNDVSKDTDKATVEGHGTAMADNLYDWRHNCFGSA